MYYSVAIISHYLLCEKKHTLSSHTGMYYQVHFYQHLPKEEDIKLPQPILPNDHCEEKTWLHLAI